MTSKAPHANCDDCPLREQPFVPTDAPRGARYAVVGIAPGFQETIYGQPFVGPTGKLLWALLERQGIKREDVLATNTVLCRPPENADPPKEAIAACRPRLENELTECKSEWLVALGGIAAKAILGSNAGILRLRVGVPKRASFLPGKRIIPTVHPAAALRSPDFLPYLLTDLKKIDAPESTWRPPKYEVARSEASALGWIDYLRRTQSVITIDIETAREKDLSFEHPTQSKILCVGVAWRADRAVVFPGAVLVRRVVGDEFRRLLRDSRINAQNGKSDLSALQRDGENLSLWFDTMLANYAQDERGGIHGLEVQGMDLLGTPPWKTEFRSKFVIDNDYGTAPPEELYKYNATDCGVTHELKDLHVARLEAAGRRGLHDYLVRASNALMQVELEGVRIDTAYLEELREYFAARLAPLQEQLSEWVANPRSWRQVQAALARLGVETPSTDVSHLSLIRERVGQLLEAGADGSARDRGEEVERFLATLLGYRALHKLASTYVAGIEKRLWKGKVYPTYKLHGTVTGRLAGANPNPQNIPVRTEEGRKIRHLFVPEPGNVFIAADYKQGEWRLVTTLAQCEYFHDVFNDASADPIAVVQGQIFGPDSFKGSMAKHFRVKTKNVVYGSLYGMILGRGKQGVAYARLLGMTNDEAYHYQKRFFALAPEILQWQERTRQVVLNGKPLMTPFGRQRHFWMVTDENRKDVLNECLAFVPQSTLSDICLSGLVRLVNLGHHPRITVHDSIVVESERLHVDRTRSAVSRILQDSAYQTFSRYVPFPVETKVGTSWGAAEESP